MRKFLIITADDFGLHEAVNEAVERASRAGVLNAASLMMGAPATADAVRRAHALPDLRVGLHIVLADGPATLAPHLIPAIADPNGKMDERMLVKSLKFFALPAVRRQLEAEIRAQFAAFACTALPLDHVNVHKHFHLHPTVLGMILRIGREYGVPAVRVPDEPLWFAAHSSRAAAMSATLLKPWVALMKRRLRGAGVFHNDTVFGIAASGAMDEATLLRIAARLPSGTTEIYLHPAAAGADISASMSHYRHADELAGLLSARVREFIAALNVGRGGFQEGRDVESTAVARGQNTNHDDRRQPKG